MDKLTDEQLAALARHAEWGHLEGEEYDAIPELVAELRQLRKDANVLDEAAAGLVNMSVAEMNAARSHAVDLLDAIELHRTDSVELLDRPTTSIDLALWSLLDDR